MNQSLRHRPGPRHGLLLAGLLTALAHAVAAQVTNPDPDRARLVTSDIPAFWRAFDGATLTDAAERFQRFYIEAGSPGVQGFLPGRIMSGRHLAATVASHPRYYQAIREATLAVDTSRALHDSVRESFRRLKALYPGAVFPDVYFVVGRLNSGGTATPAGLHIGVEMYGRMDDTPVDELTPWEKAVVGRLSDLRYIVAHELIHFQQRSSGRSATLLARALREGMADFIGELIAGGHINRTAHAYGDARERELWLEFREVMHGTDVSGWMYQGDRAGDRPADLGYWMGYRISRALHERLPDQAEAIRRLLTMDDPDALLRDSGYPDRF
jgi:hypothetical protein